MTPGPFGRLRRRLEGLGDRPGPLFLIAASWLVLEYVGLGPASFVAIHDTGDHAIPWYLWLKSSLLRNGLSYWIPSMACGVDRLSIDLQHIHWSELLFTALPGWLAYQVLAFAHYFAAGYFTFRLAREELGLSKPGAAYAGLAAALHTDFTISYQGGFALFPMALWLLGRLRDEDGWPRAFLLGLGYSFCSSFARTSLFCLPLAFAWFLFVRPRRSLRFLGMFAAFAAAASVLHLPSVWAMLLNAPLSHRAGWGTESFSGSGNLLQALTSAAASLLCFKLSLLLAAAGLIAGGWKDRRFRLLAIFTLAVASAGILDRVKASVDWLVPAFLKGFNLGRFWSLLWFFIALCGGYGIGTLPRRAWVFGAAAAVLLFQSLQLKSKNLHTWFFGGGYRANYESRVLLDLAHSGGPDPFRVATLPHGMHPAYANVYGLESVDGYLGVYPATYHRFWAQVIEPFISRKEAFRDQFFNSGNRVYLLLDEVESMPGGLPFDRFYRLNLLSLANTKFIISRHPLIHQDLVLRLDQRPWYSMDRRDRLKLRLRENLSGKKYFYIYENKSCLPRAFFAHRLRPAENAEELSAALAKAGPSSLQDTVHAEKARLGSVGPLGFSQADLSWERYSPDRLELSYQLDGPGILVVSNSWSPFWKCLVNGRPREIFPAYGAFWGVYVKKGEGRIEFRYEPPYGLL